MENRFMDFFSQKMSAQDMMNANRAAEEAEEQRRQAQARATQLLQREKPVEEQTYTSLPRQAYEGQPWENGYYQQINPGTESAPQQSYGNQGYYQRGGMQRSNELKEQLDRIESLLREYQEMLYYPAESDRDENTEALANASKAEILDAIHKMEDRLTSDTYGMEHRLSDQTTELENRLTEQNEKLTEQNKKLTEQSKKLGDQSEEMQREFSEQALAGQQKTHDIGVQTYRNVQAVVEKEIADQTTVLSDKLVQESFETRTAVKNTMQETTAKIEALSAQMDELCAQLTGAKKVHPGMLVLTILSFGASVGTFTLLILIILGLI